MSDQAAEQPRQLSEAQVQPLVDRMPGNWPEPWRDFALSVFTTLVVMKNWRALPEEELAMEAVQGIGHDLGGTQPYIPVGVKPSMRVRHQVVLELLAKGLSYRQAALKVGLTEARVRKIEATERSKRRAAARAAGK